MGRWYRVAREGANWRVKLGRGAFIPILSETQRKLEGGFDWMRRQAATLQFPIREANWLGAPIENDTSGWVERIRKLFALNVSLCASEY